MKPIHSSAAQGFSGGADAYEKGRPDYPAEAIDFLTERLQLQPGRKVLDLAAGTGKMTRLLVPSGADIVAVEPVAQMRNKLVEALPGITALTGIAESIPLPEASIDAVIVAQAFHWFDHLPALKEIQRILKPAGRLALVWNVRDEGVAWVEQLTDLIAPYEGDTPRFKSYAWRSALDQSTSFIGWESKQFPYIHHTNIQGTVDRILSISFVAAQLEQVRNEIGQKVRAIAAEVARPDGSVDYPYVTEVHVGISCPY